MLRPVALALWLLGLLLVPGAAHAVETLRIAMGEPSREVDVEARVLAQGTDGEESIFRKLDDGLAEVRVHDGHLEVNGAPVLGDSVRFRSGESALDAGVPGHEPLRAGGIEVRGDVVALRVGEHVQLINVIALEDYLTAVLGSEMPSTFPLEALKAQAVAARTYALQKKLEAYDAPYYLGSSVLSQVYGGTHHEDPRTRAAVEATRGEVLTHDLVPIEAYFHASCGGQTASGKEALGRDLPYLKSVSCPCGALPQSRWSTTVSASELEHALGGDVDALQVTQRTGTGRAARISLGGKRNVDAQSFRAKVGYARVKSLSFDVEHVGHGDVWKLSGKGFGHGAGLCQWGAKVMAEAGTGYVKILMHYYPGAELQRLY